MKAILEFDLDNPEDLEHYKRCNKATDILLMLWEFEQKVLKFKHYIPKDIDEVKEKYYELKEEYNISLDELLT